MNTLFEAICPECGGDIVQCLSELPEDQRPPEHQEEKMYTCILCGRDYTVHELKLVPLVRG